MVVQEQSELGFLSFPRSHLLLPRQLLSLELLIDLKVSARLDSPVLQQSHSLLPHLSLQKAIRIQSRHARPYTTHKLHLSHVGKRLVQAAKMIDNALFERLQSLDTSS